MLFLDVRHYLSPDAEDSYFKDKDVKTAQAIFKGQEGKSEHVDYEFRVWKGKKIFLIMSPGLILFACIGTAHGFAVRPNLAVPEVRAGYEGGLDQTVAWFKRTL